MMKSNLANKYSGRKLIVLDRKPTEDDCNLGDEILEVMYEDKTRELIKIKDIKIVEEIENELV